MLEKSLDHFANSLLTRLLVIGTGMIFMTGITSSWIGAAFQNILWGYPFFTTMIKVLFFGGAGVFISGLILLYPIERWLIRDKAIRSWNWAFARIALYTLAGIPEGFACLLGIRLGLRIYPQNVELAYFVQTLAASLVTGLLYTLIERAIAAIRKREAGYKRQIESLHIEIDQMKRSQQLNEIVESDFFQALQNKARNIRQRGEGTA